MLDEYVLKVGRDVGNWKIVRSVGKGLYGEVHVVSDIYVQIFIVTFIFFKEVGFYQRIWWHINMAKCFLKEDCY